MWEAGFDSRWDRIIIFIIHLVGKISEEQKRGILQALEERFADKDDVFDVFARVAMMGNILLLGRLIDGTFGCGILKKIGSLDVGKNFQKEFIVSF